MTTKKTSIKPQEVTDRLINAITNERARDVLMRRHGLTENGTIETLESVGNTYGITRERVRQIENHALISIRKSPDYEEVADIFTEIASILHEIGGVVAHHEVVAVLPFGQDAPNHTLFLLHVGDPFAHKKDSRDFTHHWYLDEAHATSVRNALQALYAKLDDQTILPEPEIFELFAEELEKHGVTTNDTAVLRRWLSLSKKLASNPLGEWGRITSPSVRVKGMRDLAYLTLKRHGSPLHFSEVASQIESLFGRKAHVATTHNELIKDPRFVLVGRGLYALAEWGYARGVVKDVIKEIIKEHGPLTRQEIIERVKRERYVKDNTIAVNLQDPTFVTLEDGRYGLLDQ